MKAEKQYVLITGATGGIGYELARLFAGDGHNLVIVARNSEDLAIISAELMQEFGVDVLPFATDLFVPENPFRLYQQIKMRGIHISILVNDAGQGVHGEFAGTDIYRELDIIQLNIASLVVLTKLFLKDMLLWGKGKILNLSAVATKVPGPLQSVYHGTKAFVQSFTDAIKEEIKGKNISVAAILPGIGRDNFINRTGVFEGPLEAAKSGYNALMGDTTSYGLISSIK